MQFQLITPEAILFSGEAVQVTLPGSEGMFGVLAGHAPLVATLKAGLITIELADKTQKRIVVLSGLAQVNAEQTVVLAEVAEDCSDMDAARAAQKLADAQKALDDAIGEEATQKAKHCVSIAQAMAEGLKAT